MRRGGEGGEGGGGGEEGRGRGGEGEGAGEGAVGFLDFLNREKLGGDEGGGEGFLKFDYRNPFGEEGREGEKGRRGRGGFLGRSIWKSGGMRGGKRLMKCWGSIWERLGF